MAELRPYPFSALIRRLFSELKIGEGVFDLPARKFFVGPGSLDMSVTMHGHRIGTALGPAAGPQTQMAQNLVLSYLAGCRVMELKTVQINDQLEIPRPCIDMQTVGYNVEWSQELRLQESLEEYVKGSMLIEMLRASGMSGIEENGQELLFDMSVGYDLAGIQSETVQAFMNGMMDCSDVIDRLRKQIPAEFKQYRDLNFRTKLSDSLTLSTFHGCPPDEIEKIMSFLLREKKLHAIVKLNPTLLGPTRARALLAETMGYEDIRIPESAFESDTKWPQAEAFVERLGDLADKEGRSFGVKFSNTLLVDNHRDFFPAEEASMYLSGPPLHVLAMNLVGQFRERFGDRYPISFSAGIDRNNFADAMAIGLTPITVCSDLLKPGGYARASGYLEVLGKRMHDLGASNIEDYILRAYGLAAETLESLGVSEATKQTCTNALVSGASLREAAGAHYASWVSATTLANTKHYVANCTADARYAFSQNSKIPRKVGTQLALLDCVSCNKCIPVCPNDANFSYAIPKREEDIVKLRLENGRWTARVEGKLEVTKKVQYANFADFCNECGNCDIFCPEDGGPYVVKGRFFGSLDLWRELRSHDGFFLGAGSEERMYGRFGGKEFTLEESGDRVLFAGEGFRVSLDPSDPIRGVEGHADSEVDLGYYHLMRWIRAGVMDPSSNNYLRFLHD